MTSCKEGSTGMGAGFWKLLVAAGMRFDICSCWRGTECAIPSSDVAVVRCRVPGLRRAGGIKLHNVRPKQR